MCESDRELLELAAKAAGMKVIGEFVSQPDGTGQSLGPVIEGYDKRWWNPLRYDDDALRLAVKLRMKVEINESSIVVSWISIPIHRTIKADVVTFLDSSVNVREEGEDPYAATRRAIVRAAAEIQKSKENKNV